jgi:hypothetical protein
MKKLEKLCTGIAGIRTQVRRIRTFGDNHYTTTPNDVRRVEK